MTEHTYTLTLNWAGNTGNGTAGYTAYGRDFTVQAPGKPELPGSADPAFRGDPARWNPEDLLLASLAACHKLWYLHLCAVNQVTVLAYADNPIGRMVEGAGERKGHFTEVVLRPVVALAPGGDAALALRLHAAAHQECFIANSVNFPVRCEATVSHSPAGWGLST